MSDLDRRSLSALLERPALARLLAALNGGGEETRIVGGAVRNALIGRPVMEVDCATTAAPEVTVERARSAGFKPVPTGIEHGTVTVVVDREPFEVTTLREDVETNGRHAVVRFGRDFSADAHRRDFTINALSLSVDGKLHDYTGGEADLAAGRVRFIGDAATRIREDYLRILRFFRFHSEYADGPPDPEGLAASSRERAGLDILSKERVRAELLKLLVTRRASDMLDVLLAHGFITNLIGGPGEFGRFRRVSSFSDDPVDRLAALAVMTEKQADLLRDRLRLSNGEHERLRAYGKALAVLKTQTRPVDALAIRRFVAKQGLAPVDLAAHAVTGEPTPVFEADARPALEAYRSGAEPIPVFPLRGGDLIAEGIPKGPHVGEILADARHTWMAEGCPTGEEYAADLKERVLASLGGR
ncbi:CCA tRNA nucleotidyltransferase [Microvirga pudoricolor]|uniref:CCA tRNA nucleotidyltransferase n=1 Tax=Microvirga pudoricolor TaxID=2778729 RepID=UPI00194DBCFA|nr:CCA tRNA nucleotidyltransferase [Microvirga pudoricolor]MBM6592796.1 CCA tRNA nucleotidyltransferase [Microvirga pudoricolor]